MRDTRIGRLAIVVKRISDSAPTSIDSSSRLSSAFAERDSRLVLPELKILSHDPFSMPAPNQKVIMDKSTIYFPVTCPCCGQEYVMVSNRDLIVNALATERRLTLCSICTQHRVTSVANEIERGQIREYAETLHFARSKQTRLRSYA
jgi:hypothetical protein